MGKSIEVKRGELQLILEERQKLTKRLVQPLMHFILSYCNVITPFQFCIIKCFILTLSPESDVISVKLKTELAWDITSSLTSVAQRLKGVTIQEAGSGLSWERVSQGSWKVEYLPFTSKKPVVCIKNSEWEHGWNLPVIFGQQGPQDDFEQYPYLIMKHVKPAAVVQIQGRRVMAISALCTEHCTVNAQSLSATSCKYSGVACRLPGRVYNGFHDCPLPEQLFVKLLFASLPRNTL